MDPPGVAYYLVLLYVDRSAEKLYKFAAGPLRGRFVDTFGDTRFDLLEVSIKVPREPSATIYLPSRCFGDSDHPRSRLSGFPAEEH
ncbi:MULTISPECIES: hypothetical protein [Haloferax]|uniref:Uncharacterized protein n=2 Tax=Haloferax TaxID=2251 RepID=A0A6G1Z167_9EURY|nr:MULTISPECIES: hypothetical protein [Haloferax]KAB1187603.1 hypothetical protein Hfx1149_05995 [Haloferax sp. CBA1149]MRW80262.1 hypothetical protein [Haloferax marinisediminis]